MDLFQLGSFLICRNSGYKNCWLVCWFSLLKFLMHWQKMLKYFKLCHSFIISVLNSSLVFWKPNTEPLHYLVYIKMAFWKIKRKNRVLSVLCHILDIIMGTSKILKGCFLLFRLINFELTANISEPFHISSVFFAGETTDVLGNT